jgi:hypothetical protein
MVELLDWAAERGGLWAVVAVVLAAALFYLYRARERDLRIISRERKREQRRNLQLISELAMSVREQTGRDSMQSRPYEAHFDEPSVEDDSFVEWDEPTTVTWRKQNSASDDIKKMVQEYVQNTRGLDKDNR